MSELGFWKLAEADPDHLAVVGPDGAELSAGELLARSNRLVHGLRDLGLGPGDVVAAVIGNEPSMLEVFMAVAQAGWYLVPINWHLTASEIAYVLSDSGADVLVCSPSHAEPCVRAANQAELSSTRLFCTGTAEGFSAYDDLFAGQSETAPPDRVAGAVMNYTSGTTGHPKGVQRPMHQVPPELIATGYAQFLQMFGIRPGGDGVHLVPAPLYHTAVLNFSTSSLHLGHTVVLMGEWTAEGALRCIERYRVTHSHMVPTHFTRMLALPDEVRARYDVSSLRHAIHSAAPCPVEIKRRMLDWWGAVIYEYYAATEGGGTLITAQEWLDHPGSVGRAWPGSQVEVRTDDGELCPSGEVGTVYMCMGQHRFEYKDDADKTQRAWRGDFFTVGDAGYLDDEGYLYLVDRKADMIISGGVNIYPAEIECALILHGNIADVAVFGIPNDDWGEEVKAVIEPAANVQPDDALAADILSFARANLAGYKCPRTIDFIETMPRDPNGKLYKRKLRDPYWTNQPKNI